VSTVTSERLVDLRVREFVAAMASADHPVPAGGSVAALTAASSAALLTLVCGVLQRHRPDALAELTQAAERLQRGLLELVDEDAEAFRVFLDADKSKGELQAAIAGTSRPPLKIASCCIELIELSQSVEVHTSGPMLSDVHAARLLAAAALRTALEIAQQNLAQLTDSEARAQLQAEISQLRSRQAR